METLDINENNFKTFTPEQIRKNKNINVEDKKRYLKYFVNRKYYQNHTKDETGKHKKIYCNDCNIYICNLSRHRTTKTHLKNINKEQPEQPEEIKENN